MNLIHAKEIFQRFYFASPWFKNYQASIRSQTTPRPVDASRENVVDAAVRMQRDFAGRRHRPEFDAQNKGEHDEKKRFQ